ncbi:hypothetical protein P692DRAFT_20755618, partial [Suillus brevipes Sb2]
SMQVRTELYLLFFLLKGRVYLGDIWQVVGERLLEAQREESLRSATEDSTVRVVIERAFMEEKRDRCQLEVSLCSQAIDCMQQRWIMPMCGVKAPIAYNANLFSATSRYMAGPAVPYSTAAIAYLTTVKQKCEGWLRRQHADLVPAERPSSFKRQSYPNGSTSSAIHHLSVTHLECQTSVIVNSTDPSFCLSSTWVPPGVQDALNDTRKLELSAQAGLMAMYLDIDGYNSHQRNADSELLYLRARMHHAKAEVALYELAIENVPASNFPDNGRRDFSCSFQFLMPLQLHHHHHHLHVRISHHIYPRIFLVTRNTSMLNWTMGLLSICGDVTYVCLSELRCRVGTHIFIYLCVCINLVQLCVESFSIYHHATVD